MFKIILIVTFLYVQKLTAQQGRNYNQVSNFGPDNYENEEHSLLQKLIVSRAGYVGQPPKPCSRRMIAQGHSLEIPNVLLPTYTAPILKPGGNHPVIFLRPESLKNDNNKTKEQGEVEKYPDHRHGDFNLEDNQVNAEVQPKSNDIESNTKPNTRRNLLVSEKDQSETGQLASSLNKNLHNGVFNEYNLETRKSKNYEQVEDKTETIPKDSQQQNNRENHEQFEEKTETKPSDSQQLTNHLKENGCVSNSENSKIDEDELETRRFMSNALDENVVKTNKLGDNGESESILRNNENNVLDPARGAGISELSSSPVNLLRHSRVCYACSTVTNPTCVQPDRRTTVKYCHPGHEACVTKTFRTNSNEWILTRDCGESCDDTDIPGPKYQSCSVCHTDMCNDSPNGAATHTGTFIVSVFVILVLKCTL